MIKEFIEEDLEKIINWIDPLISDHQFSNPNFSSKEDVVQFLKNLSNTEKAYLVSKEKSLGLFAFAVVEEESYMELIFSYATEEEHYQEMFAYIQENYSGYQLDLVFNPHNPYLVHYAEKHNGIFYPIQISMQLQQLQNLTHQKDIQKYQSKHFSGYQKIHSTDTYYTAEKVVADGNFSIFLAMNKEEVVGYIDIRILKENHCFIYDVYVEENYRNQGYGQALFKEAYAKINPKSLSLTVDIDNKVALQLYKNLGFYEIPLSESIFVSIRL